MTIDDRNHHGFQEESEKTKRKLYGFLYQKRCHKHTIQYNTTWTRQSGTIVRIDTNINSNSIDLIDLIGWIEFSHKLYVKNPTHGHKVEKHTIRNGKTYDVLPIQRENGNGIKTLGKSDNSKKGRKKKGETRVAVGMHTHRRTKNDCTKRRGFRESMKTKTKQNKTKVTPEKDEMASADQTPRGYKFAPLVAS